MKIAKNKKTKMGGFTVIEILITILLTTILTLILLSILLSFLESRNNVNKLNTLQDISTNIFNELAREIHWSDEVGEIAENKLTLIQIQLDGSKSEITFLVDNNQFLKNGKPFSPPEVLVNSFIVTNRRAQPDEIPCLDIKLALEYANSNPMITLGTKTTISLRKQRLNAFEE